MDKLKAMQVFIAVVEHGSFTKAAIALGVTRPSVSQTIQELERLLKTKLLERTTRKMLVTNEGRSYYHYCLEILMRIDHFETEISQAGKSLAGRLHIELSPSIAQHIILPRMNEFLVEYPKLELFLGVSDRDVDFFESTVDCVIRIGQIDAPNLIVRPIGHVNFICCASAKYIEQSSKLECLEDLYNHKIIHYFSDHTGRIIAWPFINEAGEAIEWGVRGVIAVNDAETCLQCAVNDIGIAVLADFMAVSYLKEGQLQKVLPNFSLNARPISIAYMEASRNNHKIKVFSEWFQKIWNDYHCV